MTTRGGGPTASCLPEPVSPPVGAAASRRRFRAALAGAVCGLLLATVCQAAQGDMPGPEPDRAAVSAEQVPGGSRGVASYYAKRFEGRKTTSGERYRAEKLTAAHPDLPLGTRVRVRSLDNQKEVVVRVNDRCRRRKTPSIDLSRAAARALGFLGKGIARVMIEPLPEESPAVSVAESAAR